LERLTYEEIGLLFSALPSLNSSDQIEFDLCEQTLTDKDFILILQMINQLQNGIMLNLDLVFNAIKKGGALALVHFIQTSTFQAQVTIDLSQNLLGGKAYVQLIDQTLQSNPRISNRLSITHESLEVRIPTHHDIDHLSGASRNHLPI